MHFFCVIFLSTLCFIKLVEVLSGCTLAWFWHHYDLTGSGRADTHLAVCLSEFMSDQCSLPTLPHIKSCFSLKIFSMPAGRSALSSVYPGFCSAYRPAATNTSPAALTYVVGLCFAYCVDYEETVIRLGVIQYFLFFQFLCEWQHYTSC